MIYHVKKITVCLSVPFTPFSLCSHHGIIMKFSRVITNDRSDVYAKVQGQKSKVKVAEIKTQINCFGTITPVWFHIWWWNDAQSLTLFRSGALVKFQGHTAKKNRRFQPKLGISGLYLQFEITDDYGMMHKDWHSIEEVPYCFSMLSVKFPGHRTVTPVRIHRWLWNDVQIFK